MRLGFNFCFKLFLVPLFLLSCNEKDLPSNEKTERDQLTIPASFLHSANIALEQDILYDFFSPPVAARIYLYPNLLAYEIMSHNQSDYHSLTTAIKQFPEIPKYADGQRFELAALYSFLAVSRELVYTVHHIDAEIARLDSLFANDLEIESVRKYSQEVSGFHLAMYNNRIMSHLQIPVMMLLFV